MTSSLAEITSELNVMPAIFAILALSAIAVAGKFAANHDAKHGRSILIQIGAVYSIGLSVVTFPLVLMAMDSEPLEVISREGALALVMSIAVFCAVALPFRATIKEYQSQSKIQRARALIVQFEAHYLFGILDHDGDGLVSRKNIENRLKNHPNDDVATRAILQHMLNQFEFIGHVVSRKSRVVPMWVPGIRGGTIIPTKITNTVYAIDREDFKTYPARVEERFKNW